MRKLRHKRVKSFASVHSQVLNPGLRAQAPGATAQLSRPFRTLLKGLVPPPGQCP